MAKAEKIETSQAEVIYAPELDENGRPKIRTKEEIVKAARKTFAENIIAVHDEWGYTYQQIADICGCSRASVFAWRQARTCHAEMGRITLLAKHIDRPPVNFFFKNGIHLYPENFPAPSTDMPFNDILNRTKKFDSIDSLLGNKPYVTVDVDNMIKEQDEMFKNLPLSSKTMIHHLTRMEYTHCQKKQTLISQAIKKQNSDISE